MPSQSRQSFDQNRADIDRLWAIHQEVAGEGRGRKHDVEVVNRAAIVFITSCWEAYVEDVAMEAFDFLLANASAAQIPGKVQAIVGEQLATELDKKSAWQLADSGWRAVLGAHRDAVKDKWVNSLNTPKTRQVDELFETLIGLKGISKRWFWQKMNASTASERLDEYITLRGEIAHRLKLDAPVYKGDGDAYLNHVQRLVEKTDDTVGEHVKSLVGKSPW